MTTTTISFREIVKLVHPDHNPNIQGAAEKIRDITLYRGEESVLFKLAVKWGLVPAPAGFDTRTETPSPSAAERYQARKLREYRAHIIRQEQENERRSQQRARTTRQSTVSEHRVRNRIFQIGDIIYVRTKRARVSITKVTEGRVYFRFNGKDSYAAKKNVRFTR